jgi:hypothetical protein
MRDFDNAKRLKLDQQKYAVINPISFFSTATCSLGAQAPFLFTTARDVLPYAIPKGVQPQ